MAARYDLIPNRYAWSQFENEQLGLMMNTNEVKKTKLKKKRHPKIFYVDIQKFEMLKLSMLTICVRARVLL